MSDLGNACSGFSDEEIEELRSIAQINADASGLVIKLSGWIGDRAENILKKLPEDWREHMNEAADLALRVSYTAAEATQADVTSETLVNRMLSKATGERWHKIAAAVSGVIGGAGGLATVAADLATTTTLTMRSIQEIAASYGEDIRNEEVRLNCLAVFGYGGPLTEDDEVETGLIATRLTLTGATLSEMVKRVLPRFGIIVSEKVLAQAAPVLGAAAGATINPIFVGYYQQMAHVHFRLRRLEAQHDQDQVRACYDRVMKARRQQKTGPVVKSEQGRNGQ
jgi:hypothetical protein